MQLRITVIIFLLLPAYGFAQKTCTANAGADINMGSITWTPGGGATATECNNMADGVGTFTGNVILTIANNVIVTISNDVTITGNFLVSGNSATLRVSGGNTLYVSGDVGDDDNNGVTYNVVSSTDEIYAGGTLYGKNTNAFTGAGKIHGGTLDVKNGATCGSPCPVSGGFNNCQSGGTFCSDNSVTLPILLLEFNADAKKESVQLSWTTIMEENFREFVVQRSDKGIDFEDIATVPGAGKNIFDIESHYSFEDKAPYVGLNYYRLKAVDLDDSFEYFDVVSAKYDGGKELAVYPNPSAGESISFRTNFEASETDRVIITNHLGVQIANAHAASLLENSISFDSKLFPGVYVLKYISGDFERTVKVVVKN